VSVLTEIDGPVAVVTLDWPEKRNAMGPTEAEELSGTLRAATAVESVKVVVITGNGAFCAGGDINGMVARADMPPEERRALVYFAYQGMIKTIIGLPIPTIAALDGPAVGMGFDIALACDHRIFGPAGWARQGWGGIGLIPGTGGELLLRLRAPGALWRLLPGQAKVDGAYADKLGLGEIATAGTARHSAVEVAHSLAKNTRATLEGYVELHRSALRAQLDDHLALCLATQVKLLSDPEFRNRAATAVPR
jgi:enoyl-CoA hydratase/carnithine racemase